MRKKVLVLSLLVVALGLAALIGYRLFFIKMVRVPTGAMANTIIPGDHLVVKRMFGEVKRGDIVVFRYPSQPSVQYIARIVGLPGETIEVRDKSVYINGIELQERRIIVKRIDNFDFGMLEKLSAEGSGSYPVYYFFRDKASQAQIERDFKDATFGTKEPFRIPDHQYFVLGDNRDFSYDSRVYGAVPRDLIWGKPTVIYWSSYTDGSHHDQIRWGRISTRVD